MSIFHNPRNGFGGAQVFGGGANTESTTGRFGFGQAPASAVAAGLFGGQQTATSGAPALAAATTVVTTNDQALLGLEGMLKKLVEKVEAQKAEILNEADHIIEQTKKHYMETKSENDKLKTENAELTTGLTGVEKLKAEKAELERKYEQELLKWTAEKAELERKLEQQREKFNVDNATLVQKFEQVLREHQRS